MHRTVTLGCKLWPGKQRLYERLRPRRFKWSIFPQILYDIVLCALHFLTVKFFSKYYFNKLWFELSQNVTWIDE